MNKLNELIKTGNIKQLASVLETNPALANEPIPLDDNSARAHPLHRLCDAVFNRTCREEDAVAMASLLLAFGADVDGNNREINQDTPLVAAASLHADELAFLYIDRGANITHPGTHGGTALHWAAWCGRPRLVKKLIEAGAPVNNRCSDFKSTPLLWAAHGFQSNRNLRPQQYAECVQLLVEAGADKTIPNVEGRLPFDFIPADYPGLRALLA